MKTWEVRGPKDEAITLTVPMESGKDEVETTCPVCSAFRKKKGAKCLSINISKEVWHCQHCGYVLAFEVVGSAIDHHRLDQLNQCIDPIGFNTRPRPIRWGETRTRIRVFPEWLFP